jgi:Na+-transporting NADH:ubiquinone oxidoreductase subunit NqrF
MIYNKIRASQKIGKKNRILIYPPFGIFRKKNCSTKVVFLVRKYSKYVFLRIIIFEILIRKKGFRRHIGFIRHFQFLRLETVFFIFFHVKVFKEM